MAHHRKIVRTWPAYHLTDIPPEIRSFLSEQAQERDLSVSDVIRGALCRRFRLTCPPVSRGYDSKDTGGTANLLLRLQPKLRYRLLSVSEQQGKTVRDIIIETLEAQRKEHG